MKVVSIILICLILDTENAWSQIQIDPAVINLAYGDSASQSVVTGRQLSYLKSKEVSFQASIDSTASGVVKTYKNQASLDKHIRKAGEVFLMTADLDEVSETKIFLTLRITRTNRDMYLGRHKVVVPIDSRKVELYYDDLGKIWRYSSVVKVYHKPNVHP